MKINYQSVTGWWVYCLITPDGMFYIGCSGMPPEERWKKNLYKDKSVWKYIEQYGWENIRKVILCDDLTKLQALELEDLLIIEVRKGGWCINQRRSGLIKKKDKHNYTIQHNRLYYQTHKEEVRRYNKQYKEEHKEELKEKSKEHRENNRKLLCEKQKEYYKKHTTERIEYAKKWRSTPEGKIYGRVYSYNRKHPDQIKETPMEAKQKYLQWGYIPDYIKSDDL